MSLDAGSVFVTLGGHFNPGAFTAFGSATQKAAASMQAAEAKIEASSARASAAQARAATAARRSADVTTRAAAQKATAEQTAANATVKASQQTVAANQREAASLGYVRDAQGRLRDERGRYVTDSDRVVGATDAVTRAQVRAQRGFEKVKRATKVAAVGGVGALAYAMVKSVSVAADFEQQMDATAAAANANARELRLLRRAAMEAGAGTKFSALEAAKAQEELAKGGMRVREITGGALRGALSLAAAGNMELSDAATTTVKTLALFELGADRAVHVADALASAANSTSMDVGDFAQAFAQGGAAAKAAGFDFDDTVNVMAAMADRFNSGSDMGTSLKTTLTQLAKPTDEAKAKMKDLGIEVFDAQGRMRSVKAITGDLGRAFAGMSDKERLATAATLAGTDGMRTLLALSKERAGNIIREGAALDMAAKKQDNLRGKLENFQGAVETAGIAIGSELLPLLTEWTEQGTEALSAWIESGGAAEFGEDVKTALEDLVNVAGDVIDAGGDVVGVITDIGNALGLSDVESIAAIGAAILAWKAAGSVAGGVASLATAVTRLGAASKALAAGQGAAAAIGALSGAGGLAGAGAGAAGAAGGLAGLGATLARATPYIMRAAAPLAALAAAGVALDQINGESAAERLQAIEKSIADSGASAETASLAYQRLRAAGGDVGSTFAHARHDLAAARDALAGLTPGTREYAEALLRVRDAQRAESVASGDWQRLKDGAIRSSALQARAAGEEMRAQFALAAAIRNGAEAWEDGAEKTEALADAARIETAAWNKREAALNRQASVTANLARQYRGMTQLVGQSEQALGQLARQVGGQELATTIAVRYEAPKDAGRVAAQASRALRAGVDSTIVTRVVARTESARASITAMRALIRGVPAQRVFQIIGQTRDARVQVAALRATIAGVPKEKVTRILENGSTSSKQKVDALTGAIREVPAAKRSQVSQSGAEAAQGAVSSLKGAIDALYSKSVTVTVTTVNRTINEVINKVGKMFAEGRASGTAEVGVIGEGSRWQGAREAVISSRDGSGYIVDRPTPAALRPEDNVIPLDEYRGRALGLFRQVAHDLGIASYARGRRAKKRARGRGRRARGQRARWNVPAKIAEGGVPFEDVQQSYRDARDSYDRAVAQVRDNKRSVGTAKESLRKAKKDLAQAEADGTYDRRTGEWSNRNTRINARERVKDAERRVREADAELRRSRRTRDDRRPAMEDRRARFRAAKKTDDKIKNLQTEVNLARDAMEDADRVDNRDAYLSARGRRVEKLRALIRLLQRAFGLADPNTDYGRGLRERLSTLGGQPAVDGRDGGFGGELGQTQDAEMDVEEPEEPEETEAQRADREARERLADTGMTDAERQQLADIEARQALARLTEGLGDDTSAAQEEVSFLEQILGAVQADPARGGSESITAIAEALHSAREDLRSLTTGGSTNQDADLQAQIDQQKAINEGLAARLRVSQNELAVLGGPGDIGAGRGGGPNALAMGARSAPSVVQNNYMLHPSDPSVLRAIGDAATAGINYQGGRPSPRQTVGAR